MSVMRTDPLYVDPWLKDLVLDEALNHRLIPRSKRKKRHLTPFGWFGGKFYHLDFILPLLSYCEHFVDVYGGSGVVILNRQPANIETYNDIDGNLVNFFRVLRSDGHRLAELLSMTPWSREEYLMSLIDEPDLSDLERARRFFVRAKMTFAGTSQNSTLGQWASARTKSSRGMSGLTSKWADAVDRLREISLRILRIQIENRPAVGMITKYDHPDALFYCDPPYVHESRKATDVYGFEMTDDDHRELVDTLLNIKGRFALSGYACPLYDELLGDCYRFDGPEKTQFTSDDKRVETVWTNYQPETSGQLF